jgi:hypothetical protein
MFRIVARDLFLFHRTSLEVPILSTLLPRRQTARSGMLVRSLDTNAGKLTLICNTVGVYQASGQSGYMVTESSLPTNDTIVVGQQGPGFPVTWNPRYAYAVRRVPLFLCFPSRNRH